MENFGFTKEHMDKRINELAELLDLSNILDKTFFRYQVVNGRKFLLDVVYR